MTSAVPESSGHQTHSPTVSWFELFYDLVVVAAVSLTNDVFVDHPTLSNALLAAVTMTALAWAWFLTTLYNNLFPSQDVGRRMLLLMQMGAIAVAGLAVDQNHGFSNSMGLAAYGLALSIVAILNVWGSRQDGTRVSAMSVTPVTLAAAVCFVGAFDDILRARFYVVAALVISMVPILTRQYNAWRNASRIRLDHLRERLGLFVLIVLGEGFAQLMTALHYQGSLPHTDLFVLVFLLSFAVWWIYFDGTFSQNTDLTIVRWRMSLLAHLTLVFGIAGTLDVLVLLTAGHGTELGDSALTYFVACLATVLLSFAALTYTAKGRLGLPGWMQIACAGLIVLVGGVLVPRDDTSTYAVIALSAGIVIANAVFAVWIDRGLDRQHWRQTLGAAMRGEQQEAPE
jgi:low temperature requirement protein LtrA